MVATNISDMKQCHVYDPYVIEKKDEIHSSNNPISNKADNSSRIKFVEDDICELDLFQNNDIIFTMPEKLVKERKCASCRRCFMYENNYNDHIKECLQLKLAKFVQNISYILTLRENSTISNINFMDRILNAIQNVNLILKNYNLKISEFNDIANENKSDNKGLVCDLKINSMNENIATFLMSYPNLRNIILKCIKCDVYFHTYEKIQSHYIKFHGEENRNENEIVGIIYHKKYYQNNGNC